MNVTPEQAEYLTGHQWAVLSTGRKDGSPQSSMIGYVWDGRHVLVSFRRSSAKRHNIARQPRLALVVHDGRRALTLYGTGELLEQDPARVEAFEAIMAGFRAPAAPRADNVHRLDEEGRVMLSITPAAVTLQD